MRYIYYISHTTHTTMQTVQTAQTFTRAEEEQRFKQKFEQRFKQVKKEEKRNMTFWEMATEWDWRDYNNVIKKSNIDSFDSNQKKLLADNPSPMTSFEIETDITEILCPELEISDTPSYVDNLQVLNSKLDDECFCLFNSVWTLGHLETDPNDPYKYIIVPFHTFHNEKKFWNEITKSGSLLDPGFVLNSSNINEKYIFRDDVPPHWVTGQEITYSSHWNETSERKKTKLIHEVVVRFGESNNQLQLIEAILILVIRMIGETFLSGSDYETMVKKNILSESECEYMSHYYNQKIIGIRIKPNERGGCIKVWTQENILVPYMKSTIFSVLQEYKISWNKIEVNKLDPKTEKTIPVEIIKGKTSGFDNKKNLSGNNGQNRSGNNGMSRSGNNGQNPLKNNGRNPLGNNGKNLSGNNGQNSSGNKGTFVKSRK